MSTHNICFRREIRKILCGYPLLSVAMLRNISVLSGWKKKSHIWSYWRAHHPNMVDIREAFSWQNSFLQLRFSLSWTSISKNVKVTTSGRFIDGRIICFTTNSPSISNTVTQKHCHLMWHMQRVMTQISLCIHVWSGLFSICLSKSFGYCRIH